MYLKSVTEDIKSNEKKDKAIKSDKEIVSKSDSKRNKNIISDLKIENYRELENYDRGNRKTWAWNIEKQLAQKSIMYARIEMYNKVPQNMKTIRNLKQFKREIKMWIANK